MFCPAIKTLDGYMTWKPFEGLEGLCVDILSEEYKLMQYTGLKDKNGKEIYEGSGGIDKEFGVYYVKFGIYEQISGGEHLGFYVEIPKYILVRKDLPFWISKGFEFDKNIYENPELLGETK